MFCTGGIRVHLKQLMMDSLSQPLSENEFTSTTRVAGFTTDLGPFFGMTGLQYVTITAPRSSTYCLPWDILLECLAMKKSGVSVGMLPQLCQLNKGILLSCALAS